MILHRGRLVLGIIWWSMGMSGLIQAGADVPFAHILVDLGLIAFGAFMLAVSISEKDK